MKSRLLLISILLATSAGVVTTAQSSEPDAQSQAAALLNPSQTAKSANASGEVNASSQSVGADAQAQAAALLSGTRVNHGTESARVASSDAEQSLDAQAHAAALLSGARPTADEVAPSTASVVLGDHPAVIVARTKRGIDPNTFIVAHPARLQLISTPASENSEALAAAAAKVSGAAGR